ncbi:MAG: hypothetical protein ACRESK_02895, partial [Gammaproteobacteria bacterium]
SCEVRPLVECHHLRHLARSGLFQCYINKKGDLSLTVSGAGKINAATAVCHTHALFHSLPGDAWLNIGIAGHASLAIGQPALAHRIEDAGNGRCWYPQFAFTPPCRTMNLRTLDRPSTAYEDALVDMEAAGFYATASRCSTAELIHALKIISDNAAQPAGKTEEKQVSGLIAGQLHTVNTLLESLRSLSAELAEVQALPTSYNECLERWHFTEYEQKMLLRLLNRWQLLCPDLHPLAEADRSSTGKDLIRRLEKKLGHVTIAFAE